MHFEAGRRRQLHARELCSRREQRNELRDRYPTRAGDKIALDLGPGNREWQEVSLNAPRQMDDVEAVSRLDQRADLADFQAKKRTLELRRRHAQRDLPEIAPRHSRRAVRMSSGQVLEDAGVVLQPGADGFGTLARRLEGSGLIATGRNKDV